MLELDLLAARSYGYGKRVVGAVAFPYVAAGGGSLGSSSSAGDVGEYSATVSCEGSLPGSDTVPTRARTLLGAGSCSTAGIS